MKKKHLEPGYEKIVIDFNLWLLKNHDNLLKDDLVYSLSVIEKKWKSLIDEYMNFLMNKHNYILSNFVKK